jgi:hypothetical protein
MLDIRQYTIDFWGGRHWVLINICPGYALQVLVSLRCTVGFPLLSRRFSAVNLFSTFIMQ